MSGATKLTNEERQNRLSDTLAPRQEHFPEPDPQDRLTADQLAKLGRLWDENRDFIKHACRRCFAEKAEELFSELGEVLCQPHVFSSIGPGYTEYSFRCLVVQCLRMIRRRWFTFHGRKNAAFKRWKRTTLPPTEFPSEVVSSAILSEAIAIVLLHVATLTEKRRDAIISFYLDGESLEEIAKRWGTTQSGPQNAIRRGLSDLGGRVPSSLDPGGLSEKGIIARIKYLRAKGETYGNIAKRLGMRCSESVRQRDLGLTTSNRLLRVAK